MIIDSVWNVGSKLPIIFETQPTPFVHPNELQPQKANTTRIVCVSDTHNKHDRITVPDGDIFIHGSSTT